MVYAWDGFVGGLEEWKLISFYHFLKKNSDPSLG